MTALSATAVLIVGCGGSGSSATPAAKAKAQFSLPAPTGQYQLGTMEIQLVDQARQDPWKPDHKREIMISIWYPAKDTNASPRLRPC